MRRALSLIAVTALIVLSPPVFANTLTGNVVKVADGDTITVLDQINTQHRIRLQGIDAPREEPALRQCLTKASGEFRCRQDRNCGKD